MVLRFPYYIIRHIFQYLNGEDLRSVSQISRVWWEAAHDENYKRGPSGFTYLTARVMSHSKAELEKFLNKPTPTFISFYLLIIYKEMLINIMKGCPCQYLPANSYKLLIEMYFPMNRLILLVNLSLPDSYKIQINTYSFIKFENESTIMCPELRTICYPRFTLLSFMKDELKRYFDRNSPMKTAMILLCQMDQMNLLKDILTQLVDWFPLVDVPIWGGLIFKMLICKKYVNISQSSSSLSCLFIFISKRELKIWTTTFYNCNNYRRSKFEKFRKKVQLRKYSLGFIYSHFVLSPLMAEYNNDLFRKFFPDIPFVNYYGTAAFGGKRLEDILESISKWSPLCKNGPRITGEPETSIMILTYN